jgi:hypothetical protein
MADVDLLARKSLPARTNVAAPNGGNWIEVRFRPGIGETLSLRSDGSADVIWAYPSDFADPTVVDGTSAAADSEDTLAAAEKWTNIPLTSRGQVWTNIDGSKQTYSSIFLRAPGAAPVPCTVTVV